MIYDAHQPLGSGFEPPRAGTMPERRKPVTLGLDDATAHKAMRSSEAPGHLSGMRFKRDTAGARKRGTAAAAAVNRRDAA